MTPRGLQTSTFGSEVDAQASARSAASGARLRSEISPSLHIEQFDVEDQRGVGRDDAAGAARPVAELGRDDQGALAADLHAGDALVPAGDDLMPPERELERLTAVERAVELLALGAILIEPACVMHDAGLTGLRR